MPLEQPSESRLRDLSDEFLIDLIVQREEAALGELYDRYAALVYAIALRITGDRQTAEEVMQDVFHNIWQTAGGFRRQAGLVVHWLIGISRHRAIDALRSKRERVRRREVTGVDVGTLLPAGVESVLEQRMLRETVRAALADLPPAQRQAIEMAYYGGLTQSEIAEQLGEPLGTIKTRLRLGLLKLRDVLRSLVE
ncbi:sigma-70 family RNA polymerase sigma factor [Chloroflexus aggregans]|uniref:RNA polymerase, sigma-24 subunit, ECF subfamily n=1 Tax=Chloroflexus aggregans (strain MD-66 / DSM 9485) TaxID=326427 RepID=B8G9Y5_CHLAD|nr:sigma-70 family RNA polymerase sigma factor [Chloroflexus aggregans]ACL24500.1 RNA polymerase, sigma-24 subunit, ECF subfamily [Chloroflexus aggregans DSM 9485]